MEKLKFPLAFDKCPNCASTRRVANEVLEGEKEKGKVNPYTHAFIFQQQSIILDPTRTALSAPVILSFFDTCADCGSVYCVHAELRVAIPGVNKEQPPPLAFGKNN